MAKALFKAFLLMLYAIQTAKKLDNEEQMMTAKTINLFILRTA
jgi:hypothetical protein